MTRDCWSVWNSWAARNGKNGEFYYRWYFIFDFLLCVRKFFVKERFVHVGKLSKSKYSRKRPVETSHQEFLNFQHKAIK